MEKVIMELYSQTTPGLGGVRGKFHQIFKNKVLSKLFQSTEKGQFPNSFSEVNVTLTPELVKTGAEKIKLQTNSICNN